MSGDVKVRLLIVVVPAGLIRILPSAVIFTSPVPAPVFEAEMNNVSTMALLAARLKSELVVPPMLMGPLVTSISTAVWASISTPPPRALMSMASVPNPRLFVMAMVSVEPPLVLRLTAPGIMLFETKSISLVPLILNGPLALVVMD